MSIWIKLKPVINKKTRQINISLPRKKLPQEILDAIDKYPSATREFIFKMRNKK